MVYTRHVKHFRHFGRSVIVWQSFVLVIKFIHLKVSTLLKINRRWRLDSPLNFWNERAVKIMNIDFFLFSNSKFKVLVGRQRFSSNVAYIKRILLFGRWENAINLKFDRLLDKNSPLFPQINEHRRRQHTSHINKLSNSSFKPHWRFIAVNLLNIFEFCQHWIDINLNLIINTFITYLSNCKKIINLQFKRINKRWGNSSQSPKCIDYHI